jgi:hypothetical protein
MMTILKRFRKKISGKGSVEIDDDIVREAKRSSEKSIMDYKDYRSKDISWLENHLHATEEVIVENKFGAKNKAQFLVDGYKFFKDEVTAELLNRLFENYNAYHINLKKYISLRKELLEYSNLNSDDSVFAAGHVKDTEDQLKGFEKKLNVYLDNINRLKKRIRETVGLNK